MENHKNGQKYSLNAKYNTSPRMDNYKNGQIPTKTVDATVDMTSNGQPQEWTKV